MRKLAPVLFGMSCSCLLTSACHINGQSIGGPSPVAVEITREDEGFPSEAVLCADLGGTLVVAGDHFSPLAVNVIAGEQSIELPRVEIVSEEGSATALSEVTFDPDAGTLTALVPAGVAVGTHDVRVTNPNHKEGTLAGALEIVPPPRLSAIAPVLGCNGLTTDVVVTGNYFRKAADGTLPALSLVPRGGGTEADLAALAFVSATELTATVPMGLSPGMYDLLVRNPEGCSVTLQDAFEVVPPPEITAIAPNQASNAAAVPVTLTGNYFRIGTDNALPSVSLIRSGTTDTYELSGVIVVPPSEITAVVPALLPVGFYDLEVKNPEGCSVILENAYAALPGTPLDLCTSVDPAFGWEGERTKIEICAYNAGGHGLLSTPEAFILIPDAQNSATIHEIPLIREAFLAPGDLTSPSVMSALIPSSTDDARIMAGGPFSIKVVNPNGDTGFVLGAFTLLPDPPPDITEINPALGDKLSSTTITVTGRNFKPGTLEDGTTPILSIDLLDESLAVAATCTAGTVGVQNDVAPGVDLASCNMVLPAVGMYLVRVKHADDGSYDLYAAFAVTSPSGKLEVTPVTLGASLQVARRAHGVAMGKDDLGNRFVYAVGGENSTGELDSVEVSMLSNFGQLGAWTELSENSLPEPRTGLCLLNVGRYLYAIGGSPDSANPATSSTVLRAKILGTDDAPVIQGAESESGTGGALAAGTWYYKVTAIMKATTDNPLGETLPSDEESIRVAANSKVTLTFTVADSTAVDHFHVYRSTAENGLSCTERLLVVDVPVAGVQTSWIDDGGYALDPAVAPLPSGSLGKWVAVAELGTKRYDAASVTVRTDPTHVYLYVTGGRTGPVVSPGNNVTASTEWVALSGDGRDLQTGWNAGPSLQSARAEHVLVRVGPDNASVISSNHHLVALGGSSKDREEGTALKSIESSLIDTTNGSTLGTPSSFQTLGVNMQNDRIGFAGVHVNDYLYAFNGWAGSGTSFQNAGEKSTAETAESGCPAACLPDFSSITSTTLTIATEQTGIRYRSGLVFFGAYFYWIGGSSLVTDLGTTSGIVVRDSYSTSE